MKVNKTILIFTLGIVLMTISFRIISFKDSENRVNAKKDTTYYHVYIGIERGVTEEFIKTYDYNSKLVADILVIKYSEFSYTGKPTIRYYLDSNRTERQILSSRKIDTLNIFKKMVATNSIRHNQGIKIAGRHGSYSVVLNGDTIKSESLELYSLVDAVNFIRK
jgi:hypothetical protein